MNERGISADELIRENRKRIDELELCIRGIPKDSELYFKIRDKIEDLESNISEEQNYRRNHSQNLKNYTKYIEIYKKAETIKKVIEKIPIDSPTARQQEILNNARSTLESLQYKLDDLQYGLR